jgi:catechol-2,3-dioxygenase
MKPKAHHIALKVRDLNLCGQFYAALLGLEVLQRQTDSDGTIRSLWFDLDGVILMLERWSGAAKAGPENPGWHLLALAIPAVDRNGWQDKLARAGVRITGESAYSIYFSDPEGNRLALSHYPEQAAAQPA